MDYLGGWNEHTPDSTEGSWDLNLKNTLTADHFTPELVAYDLDYPSNIGADVANTISSNSAFASAVGIIGVHYPCGAPPSTFTNCSTSSQAQSSGKTLWASESGSEDADNGAPRWRADSTATTSTAR